MHPEDMSTEYTPFNWTNMDDDEYCGNNDHNREEKTYEIIKEEDYLKS